MTEFIEVDGVKYNGDKTYRATTALLNLGVAARYILRAGAFVPDMAADNADEILKALRQMQQGIREQMQKETATPERKGAAIS